MPLQREALSIVTDTHGQSKPHFTSDPSVRRYPDHFARPFRVRCPNRLRRPIGSFGAPCPCMNVLFLSQIIPYPPHGGVLQRGFNVLRELSKHAQVHLLAFWHPDTLPADRLPQSREALGRFCASVEYFPLWPKRSALARRFAFAAGAVWFEPFSVLAHRSRSFAARADEIMRTRSIDVAHFDTIALSQFDRCDAVTRVVTHHNIESMLMGRRAAAERSFAARAYMRAQTRRLIRYESQMSPRYDMNIVMSAPDAAALECIAPGVETAIVPNGADLEYFQPRRGEETPAVIYTGGMNMFANRDAVMHFLQTSWPAIKAAVPEAVFYAVGQDPPRELLRLATPQAGIVATGYVDDVRPWVARSAVYVVPLRVGGGTRLKVVDAMAQGKALVSTAIGCEGIEVTPGENVVIADEPRAFADAVVRLLRAPAERERLGRAARAFVEQRYAWSVIGQRLLEAYERATENHRRRGRPA